MSQRGKRRTAKLLALVMLTALLCSSTVMAEEYFANPYVEMLKAGDRITAISIGMPGGESKYLDYDFFINGVQYFPSAETGMVDLNGAHYEVQTADIDDIDKKVDITADWLISIYQEGTWSWKKSGETVTFDLSKEWKKKLDELSMGNSINIEFIKWYVWAQRTDGTNKDYTLEEAVSVLGVAADIWKNPSAVITFSIPSVWEENQYTMVGIDSAYNDNSDSTVSGNIPSGADGNRGSSSDRTTAPETVSRKDVILSNGTILTSAGAMHNEAGGINGAAVLTSQEEMNKGAGLSPQDTAAGTNASLYIGSTYKTAEKLMLTNAVSQTGAKAINMINIDLYTIAKSGKIDNVTKLDGENPESVQVVIGLPEGAVKEGRSFSLVYMDENGKAVEIPDLDNDPRTLTVDLTRFGSFAIVYR